MSAARPVLAHAAKRHRTEVPDDAGGVRFVAAAAETSWHELRRRLKRCRRHPGKEEVHELRIQTRRLLVVLELAAGLGVEKSSGKVRRKVAKLSRSLARLRDTQVQMQFCQVAPAVARGAARQLRRELRDERSRRARRAARRLHKLHLRPFEALVAKVARGLRRQERNLPARTSAVRTIRRWLDDCFERVREEHAAIAQDRPETLHRLRLALKHFRYAVELLAPRLPAASAACLRRLRAVQGKLGEIQDLVVFQGRLEGGDAPRRGRAAESAAWVRWIERKSARRIRRFIASSRQVPMLWPPRAGRSDQRRN